MQKYLIVVFLLNSFSFAQDEIENSFWGQVGTGISFMNFTDSNVGFNLLVSLNYEIQNNNFGISYLRSSEFSMFTHPEEYIKSIELKYGRSFDFNLRGLIFPFPLLLIIKKNFNYSLTGKIGVSYNEGLERTTISKNEFFNDRYDSKVTNGFGLPVEIDLREEITSFFGMGLSVHINLNKVKNYFEFNFNIYVGQF